MFRPIVFIFVLMSFVQLIAQDKTDSLKFRAPNFKPGISETDSQALLLQKKIDSLQFKINNSLALPKTGIVTSKKFAIHTPDIANERRRMNSPNF